MLNWLRPFSIFCLLDNGSYSLEPHQYDFLLAVGAKDFIEGDNLDSLDEFIERNGQVFGHLSYELKESIHDLRLHKKDRIGFPPYYFFAPQIVVEINAFTVRISADDADAVFADIDKQETMVEKNSLSITPEFVLTKEEYLKKIAALQQHILRGDCYEINFCMEAFASSITVSPFAIYQQLLTISSNPFAAFYRLNDKYLVCASPERFLTRKGNTIFSQPIKGTIKRDLSNSIRDEELKKELTESRKDQSENVMVVDLVRNDLTRVCEEASVKVDELFGVYSYPQVHQMVSTISGTLKEGITFSEIINATFPMGSMTGAPKHRVMQLIDEYEPSARGIFSGSVGYINADGNFDFNVVIRSIMYNESERCLSYQVGSGITFYSDAEKEWEECMLKAEAIKKVLAG